MKETKIVVKIDHDGCITSETSGFVGPSCLSELEELFKDIAILDEIVKTDEFFKVEAKKQKSLEIIQKGVKK